MTQEQQEEVPAVGSRLTCATCGAQVVVVKAGDQPVKCCGEKLGKS